jgi:hypothetical protein
VQRRRKILAEITLVRPAKLDIDQNIADLRLNNNLISMASGGMNTTFGVTLENDFRSKSTGYQSAPRQRGALRRRSRFMPRWDGISWRAGGRRSRDTVSPAPCEGFARRGFRFAGRRSWDTVSPSRVRHKKKGAQRAPPTPTESLRATTRSRHHKTHAQYGYLSPGAF